MSSPSTEQQWEQPSFDFPDAAAPVTGVVLAPGVRSVLPVPGPEEASLAVALRWVWPVALVVAVVSGNLLQLVVLALIVRAVLKHRVRELQARRLVSLTTLR